MGEEKAKHGVLNIATPQYTIMACELKDCQKEGA